MNFKGKVVVVTGSSSGIGAATAIAFAKEGADVVLVGRNENKLKNVSNQCENVGKKPLVIKADVSKDKEARTIINGTIEHFGQLDVLVNNAGVGCEVDITNHNFMDTYDRIMNVNLRAVVFITHLAVPYLTKSKGSIINISSIAGSETMVPGVSKMIPYRTSKAGLNHFSRSIAARLAPHGVRVNIVSPGPVKTDIIENSSTETISWDMFKQHTALNRVSEPEEIADLIVFLASDKARGITGSNFISDNGYLVKS